MEYAILRQLLSIAMATICIGAAAAQTESSFSVKSQPAGPNWPSFVDQFLEDYFHANPSFAVTVGRHEFDGQLPDWSASGIRGEVTRLEKWRSEASGYADSALSSEQRFQRDYLISRIDDDLFWLRDARQPFSNPSFYVQDGLDPNTYVAVPYAPADQRLRAFISYAKKIPAAVSQIKANLKPPLPRTFIDYGIAAFNGLADFYRNDTMEAFAGVDDKPLQLELRAASEPAAAAMAELALWLQSQKERASDAYALGTDRFKQMLRMTERVTTGLDKLESVGHADLERNLVALAQACEAFMPDASISDCVAREAADKPTGGAVEARAQSTGCA